MTQPEIAEELEVSQPTISRDLAALREQWRESALIDINEAKERELAKVDALELEYWDAWRKSCEDAEIIRQKGIESKDGQRKEATKEVRGQSGDPRFLAGVQWCINKRCEIIGIDAPKRTDITTNGESIKPNDEYYSRSISALSDVLRTALSGESAGKTSDMDATE